MAYICLVNLSWFSCKPASAPAHEYLKNRLRVFRDFGAPGPSAPATLLTAQESQSTQLLTTDFACRPDSDGLWATFRTTKGYKSRKPTYKPQGDLLGRSAGLSPQQAWVGVLHLPFSSYVSWASPSASLRLHVPLTAQWKRGGALTAHGRSGD